MRLKKIIISSLLVLLMGEALYLFHNLIVKAVRAETNKIEIFPTSFSVDPPIDGRGWQNPRAVFIRDLDKNASFEKFNFENSAYLIEAGFLTENTTSTPATESVEKTLELSGFNLTNESKESKEEEIKNVRLRVSLAAQGEANDKLVTGYFSRGTWQNLAEFNLANEISNARNSGYFLYALPIFEDWQELESLKVKFTYQAKGPSLTPKIYLDSLWLEVETEREIERKIEEEESRILPEKTENLFRKFFRSDEKPEFLIPKITFDQITLINPAGKETLTDFSVIETKENYKIKIEQKQGFRPGKYILKIKTRQATIEQEFLWGVLGINTNRSIYLPNKTSYLQMASLNEDGHTLCDSNLKLEITNPVGLIAVPQIEKSGECGPNNVTDKPDYFAYYQVGEAGKYEMKLTNLDNGYEITDFFDVRKSVPFDVERVGPTRIYPPASYEMKLNIKANEDFNGEVKESVPAFFEILNPKSLPRRQAGEIRNNFKIRNSNDQKIIVWRVDWKAGETHELKYTFDAPDISPYLYLLGPLEMGGFKEVRHWQIASDAPATKTYIFWDPANDPVPDGWTRITDYDGKFPRGQADTIVTQPPSTGGAANHTPTAAIVTASGATTARRDGTGGTANSTAHQTHTHTATIQSITAADNLPLFRSLNLIEYSGIPTQIPINGIVLFDNDPGIPGGWTNLSGSGQPFENRMIRINATVTNGGSDTHAHTVTWDNLGAAVGTITPYTVLDIGAKAGHTHTAPSNSTTDSQTSLPPYLGVVMGQAPSLANIPAGAILMFDGDPGTNWEIKSNSGGDFYEKFIHGEAAYNPTGGGASTHSHANTVSGNTAGPSLLSQARTGAAANTASSLHTHTITATWNPNESHTPSYVDVVFAEYSYVPSVLTQNYYRFYVDNDAIQPTDPWPPGGSDLGENAPITTSDSPPDDNDLTRIRMSVQVSGQNLAAGAQDFKLQYVERSDGNCASATGWTAVGAAGSAEIWRGESDNTPADGTTLSAVLLFVSDVVESYEEQNNSVLNPNAINVGQDGEWDWLIQNNGAVHDTLYCFRMVKSDDTPLDGYNNYPKISTELTVFNSSFDGGNGRLFVKPYSGSSTKVSYESNGDCCDPTSNDCSVKIPGCAVHGGGGPSPCALSVAKQNNFYFSMNNALNQSIEFTMLCATGPNSQNVTNEQSRWTNHKPAYSYDGVTWYRTADAGTVTGICSQGGSNFVYTAPGGGAKFTQDTVYLAYNIPYTYTDYLNDLDVWDNSPYVSVTNIGTSALGRDMHLLTIQDASSPIPAAEKKVYWNIARQHPLESMSNHMIKGVIDFLIGSSEEAAIMRRTSIFKIIAMMNPDGSYYGWTRINAQYCNLNREWMDLANQTDEAQEVYLAHSELDDWMSNGTPADAEAFIDYHTCASCDGSNYVPYVIHYNFTGDDDIEQPFEDLFTLLDGNTHLTEFADASLAGTTYAALHLQYYGPKGMLPFLLEGPDIKFSSGWPTKQNCQAFGLGFAKTQFAKFETKTPVFLLEQTDSGDSTPQYVVGVSPGEYHISFDSQKGGSITNWWDLENQPNHSVSGVQLNLGDLTNGIDRVEWSDGTIRTLTAATNVSKTINSSVADGGVVAKITYTGRLGGVTGYDYELQRTFWEDGRPWTQFKLTNNTGGSVNWSTMSHYTSIRSAAADTNFSFLYDNSATTPTPGTDNWWAQVGTSGGTPARKASIVAHYVTQDGGWVYDTYSESTGPPRWNYYQDADGPVQSNGSSITVNLCYQIRPDNDLLGNETQIDVWRNDIANPDTPIMINGTFTAWRPAEGALEFNASSNHVKFTYTNAATYTKKKPAWKITSYTASTAPVLKVNNQFLDGENGSAHPGKAHYGTSYISYVDTTNDIAYIQYLLDVSSNVDIEIKDEYATIISVTVSDGVVTYGTIPLNSSKSTLDLGDMQIATNNGNTTENFNIKGKNSDWTLSAAPGNEQYSHQFCNQTDNICTPETEPPFVDLTVNYQALDTGIPQGGTVNVHLQVWTPTATIYYTVQDIDVTIQAVQG